MPHAVTPKILFIDAYDSFSNNIISLLETQLLAEVTTIKIDENITDFAAFLKSFNAVVAGPGPGNPKNADDVGVFSELWKLKEDDLLPILGICLGFQSLVLTFGGKVEALPEPRHGILRRIHSDGISIFEGTKEIITVQYHSLHASLKRPRYSTQETWCQEGLHRSIKTCGELTPLAWDNARDNDSPGEVGNRNPDSILMAVKHRHKPFYGVQFHPESVCSNESARHILRAWWKEVLCWRKNNNMTETISQEQSLYAANEVKKLRSKDQNKTLTNPVFGHAGRCGNPKGKAPLTKSLNHRHEMPRLPRQCRHRAPIAGIPISYKRYQVITEIIDLDQITVRAICETLKLTEGETVILDSEFHQREDVGTHSIIGVISHDSLKLEYSVGSGDVHYICGGKSTLLDLRSYNGSIFSYLKGFMKDRQARDGHIEAPFWGGLMGYITYEACRETIGFHQDKGEGSSDSLKADRPHLCFVFVERSIVIDHQSQKLYIQSIKPNDARWIEETTLLLGRPVLFTKQSQFSLSPVPKISYPDPETYKSQIRSCQTSIRAGDAYELCLTTRATITPQTRLPSWPLYLRLRSLNPAPFSAYIRLGGLTLLSSSPERFLRWSRPTHTRDVNGYNQTLKSTCQFRPIKGTIKRFRHPSAPATTLAEATAMLSTPKERAENLMIVDLIRHDLHGVVGSGNVRVSKLMAVEEYATLYQLVTVIEGDLISTNHEPERRQVQDREDHPAAPRRRTSVSGIDVLAASLPPGSMTGAPKRRSCKLLNELEGRDRGVYSGVVGYLDIGGGGDFSVVIRSAVRWDDDEGTEKSVSEERQGEENSTGKNRDERPETWTIGAGGAVTALSDEEGEWQEMLAKLKSTLGLFEGTRV